MYFARITSGDTAVHLDCLLDGISAMLSGAVNKVDDPFTDLTLEEVSRRCRSW